jgi:hypothetical protein
VLALFDRETLSTRPVMVLKRGQAVLISLQNMDTSKEVSHDFRGISSAGRAPALQAGGQRFDPVMLHHLPPFW